MIHSYSLKGKNTEKPGTFIVIYSGISNLNVLCSSANSKFLSHKNSTKHTSLNVNRTWHILEARFNLAHFCTET